MAKPISLDRAIADQLKVTKPKKRKRRTKARDVATGLDAVIVTEDSKKLLEDVAAVVDKLQTELEARKDSRTTQVRGLARSNRDRKRAKDKEYNPYRKRFQQLAPEIGTAAAIEKVGGEMAADGIVLSDRRLYEQLRRPVTE